MIDSARASGRTTANLIATYFVWACSTGLGGCGQVQASTELVDAASDDSRSERDATTDTTRPPRDASLDGSVRRDAMRVDGPSSTRDVAADAAFPQEASTDASDGQAFDGPLLGPDGCGVLCGSTCVDLQNDPANCGQCGNACDMDAGQGCRDGLCCAAGDTICNGACSNLNTDPMNCGACGVVCDGTCQAPHCLVTLTSDYQVTSLVTDGTNLYWTGEMGDAGWGGQGLVMKMPTSGGNPTTLATQGEPVSLAIDATSAYWMDYTERTVVKVPLAGGVPVTLDTTPISPFDYSLTVDNSNVYWSAAGGLLSEPIQGGGVTTLVGAQYDIAGVAVDSVNVYWTKWGTCDSSNDGTVMMMPLVGGPAVTLASNQLCPWQIATDGTRVYWATADKSDTWYLGTIVSVPVVGGNPITLASQQPSPVGLAIDGTSVFWTNAAANPLGGPADMGGLFSVPLNGGVTTTLGSGNDFGAVATDGTNVYWYAPPSSILKVKIQ
jgi:hypothetical protein